MTGSSGGRPRCAKLRGTAVRHPALSNGRATACGSRNGLMPATEPFHMKTTTRSHRLPAAAALAGIPLRALTGGEGPPATSPSAPASAAPAAESAAPAASPTSSASEKPARGYDPAANAKADITAALKAAKKDGR